MSTTDSGTGILATPMTLQVSYNAAHQVANSYASMFGKKPSLFDVMRTSDRRQGPKLSDKVGDFLIVSEAAALLRVATATIYGWVHQRRIPFRKHGSRIAFLRSDLESWSKSQEINGVSTDRFFPASKCAITPAVPKPAKGSLKTEQTDAGATTTKKGGRRGSM